MDEGTAQDLDVNVSDKLQVAFIPYVLLSITDCSEQGLKVCD